MPALYLGMSGSKEDEGPLLGGGARALGLGGAVWEHQSVGLSSEWGAGLAVWEHQSAEEEAAWGQAPGRGLSSPYVRGHEWQR